MLEMLSKLIIQSLIILFSHLTHTWVSDISLQLFSSLSPEDDQLVQNSNCKTLTVYILYIYKLHV